MRDLGMRRKVPGSPLRLLRFTNSRSTGKCYSDQLDTTKLRIARESIEPPNLLPPDSLDLRKSGKKWKKSGKTKQFGHDTKQKTFRFGKGGSKTKTSLRVRFDLSQNQTHILPYKIYDNHEDDTTKNQKNSSDGHEVLSVIKSDVWWSTEDHKKRQSKFYKTMTSDEDCLFYIDCAQKLESQIIDTVKARIPHFRMGDKFEEVADDISKIVFIKYNAILMDTEPSFFDFRGMESHSRRYRQLSLRKSLRHSYLMKRYVSYTSEGGDTERSLCKFREKQTLECRLLAWIWACIDSIESSKTTEIEEIHV